MGRLAMVSGVVVEEVGDDLMVMVPGSTEVLSVSGDAADAVRRVQSGSAVVNDAVVSDLVRMGVIQTSGLNRRELIKAGAIGAGAGIAVLAMPGVAMASSEDFLAGKWIYFLQINSVGFEGILPPDSPLQNGQTFRLIPDDGGFGIKLRTGESDEAMVVDEFLGWGQPFGFDTQPSTSAGSTLTGTVQEVGGELRTFRVRFTFSE
jgi:hypothetical protein